MPTDVVRFYQQFGSATIYGEDRVPLYRILPLAEWVDPEAQSQPPDGEFERVREFKMVSQLRFAESSDGVGILIKVERSEGDDLGSVVIGCGRDGKPVPQTGQKVAKSFTDFLLKALDGGVFRGSRSV
jgi:hypothetical protein